MDSLFLDFQESLAGRYSLDRELGRGGMGIVYLAREVHLDRPVAIKLLPPERAMEPSLKERFLREARLAAKLSHPNIIPIHAVEDRDGFVFYVMSFVDGETLANRVRTRGPLTSADGTRVLREAAWALAHAHAQGLVHRDVKPDNILLEGAAGRVLVADFGIAAAFDDPTEPGVVGTPEFMSPEQALGQPLDARSDLYGLGATAFYAFSGRCPFEGATPTEVLAKQVTEPAPALASTGVVVPRKLAALIDRCLAKDPHQRPESATALAEQLGVALEQRRELPVALRAFVKRNARLDGSGTLLGALLLVPTSAFAAAIGGLYFESQQLAIIAGYGTFVVGGLLAPAAYLVGQARRILRQGFAHQDLKPAFDAESERAREELASTRRLAPPGFIERSLGKFARVVGAASGALVLSDVALVAVAGPNVAGWWIDALGPIPFLSFGVAIIAFVLDMQLGQRRRDIDTEFWARQWTGRIGKLLFGIAKKTLGKEAPLSAMTHRATELSLGLAAEQLYEGLPRETRKQLHELPPILKRLQDDAQALRRRYDDLKEAIATAGDAATGPEYTDVREARDEIHAKLGETVGALETIRLQLLRLHAGSTSLHGLTTHLGVAAEVSEQVERLIAAHEEVERGLEFPRLTAPTPV